MSRTNYQVTWAVVFGLLALAFAAAARDMTVDLDLFHEMALYRQLESTGQMPTTDDFAYTPTVTPVVHHEWATGAVVYWVTVKTGWGEAGLVAFKFLLSMLLCLGCYGYARKQGASLAIFALLAPIGLKCGLWMAFTNIRAQLFTLVFLVGMYFLLDQDRRGKRWWIAAWVPLLIVWANMHGGVVSGLGLLGVYGCARLIDAFWETHSVSQTLSRVGHLVAVGGLSVALLYVNPYGTDYVPYLIRAVTMERPSIVEWWPLWRVQPLPLAYLFSVGLALLAIAQRGRESVFESLALLLTAYLALKHYRHGSLYAVTWLCFVPSMLQRSELAQKVEELWGNMTSQVAVLGVAVGVVAVGFSIQARFWELRIPTEKPTPTAKVAVFPAGVVEYLRDHQFQGNVWAPFAVGAYLSWNLYPEVKVSLDSRYEVAYPSIRIDEDKQLYTAADGWQALLDKYPTDVLLIPQDYPLASVMGEFTAGSLAHSQGPSGAGVVRQAGHARSRLPWTEVYRDRGYVVYVRDGLASRFRKTDRSQEAIRGVFP